MARYIDRVCPRCKGFLGIVILKHERKGNDYQVNGLCATCGYQLKWKLVSGEKATRYTGFRRPHGSSVAK